MKFNWAPVLMDPLHHHLLHFLYTHSWTWMDKQKIRLHNRLFSEKLITLDITNQHGLAFRSNAKLLLTKCSST